MGLLDDLQPPKKIWPCRVRDVASTLGDDDAKILLAAVANEAWAIAGLSRELNSRGIVISDVPIKAHRAKACSCFRA